jgi:ribosomal protein L24
MNVGDTVLVSLGSDSRASGQVIEINADSVRVAGFEEIQRASDQGRQPIGLTFSLEKVKEKREKNS